MKAPRELLPIKGRRCVAVGGRVPCRDCGAMFLALWWLHERLEVSEVCSCCRVLRDVEGRR